MQKHINKSNFHQVNKRLLIDSLIYVLNIVVSSSSNKDSKLTSDNKFNTGPLS